MIDLLSLHEDEDYSRQVAKTRSSKSFFLPLRLCVFARGIPTFGCGSAAPDLRGEISVPPLVAASPH